MYQGVEDFLFEWHSTLGNAKVFFVSLAISLPPTQYTTRQLLFFPGRPREGFAQLRTAVSLRAACLPPRLVFSCAPLYRAPHLGASRIPRCQRSGRVGQQRDPVTSHQ